MEAELVFEIGEKGWYELRLFPVPDGILVISRNITARKAREDKLEWAREFLDNVINAMPNPVFVKDQQHRWLIVNDALCAMMGRCREELLGQSDYEFLPVAEADVYWEKDDLVFESGEIHENEESLTDVKGLTHTILTRKSILSDETGQKILIGIITDVTERKRAENQIKAALREKEALLAEIHHRVKNNLQIVSSMFNFQTYYTQDEQTIEVLRDCERRVRSMALIHAQLYRAADLAQIDFRGYVESLASELFAAYRTNAQHVALKNVFFEVKQAIPCGLLINELMSNALKYAFPAAWERPDEADNEIRVALSSQEDALSAQEDGQYVLIVSDNGVGLPPDFIFPNEDTLGIFLIETFAEQLEGIVEWHNENGTTCTIVFTITK